MDDFSPREAFDNALHGWWLVALLAFWGGLVGWGIHLVKPPLYDASAIINFSINYSQTGKLTQMEEDHAWEMMGTLIRSAAVLQPVITQAKTQGIDLGSQPLGSRLFLERKEYAWEFIARLPDPNQSATAVNLWVDEVDAQLNQALAHAEQAQVLQRRLNTLEDCLARSPATAPAASPCSLVSFADLQSQMKTTNQALQQELAGSRGLLPAISYQVAQRASPPSGPTTYGRNLLVLAGGLIGFILGVWVVNLRLPRRLARRLGHA